LLPPSPPYSPAGEAETPLARPMKMKSLYVDADACVYFQVHKACMRVVAKGDVMPDSYQNFELSVAEDGMVVLLNCRFRERRIGALVRDIREQLSSMGVVEIPSRQDMERRLREAGEGKLVDMILVEGKWAVPSRDGSVEWAEDFFSSGFAVDEKTGAIDYWRRADQRGVKEGQLLATMTPAKMGEAGVDVYGKRIPVEKPKRARMRPGPNVRVVEEEDVVKFCAEANGRIRWVGGLLAVDSVYTVSGDVGLATGYIEHPGSIVVRGDVLAGSRITSSGDIEVMGTVEAADIETEGNLTVRGGVAGAEGRRIKIGGSFHARFILNVDVEAGEDVVVEKDVTNSVVKTRGALRVPVGRVAGGEVVALGGIVVGQGGSDGQVPTLLTAGEDFWAVGELAKKEKQAEQLEANLQKLRNAAAPLSFRRKKQMTANQRQLIARLLKRISELETELEDLRDDMEKVAEDSRLRAKQEIVVNGTVYPETVLSIRGKSLKVREAFRGPLCAKVMKGQVEIVAT